MSNIANRFQERPCVVGLGPSVLRSIAIHEIDLSRDSRIAVPDVLLKLLEQVHKGDSRAVDVLSSVFRHFGVGAAKPRSDQKQDAYSIAESLFNVIRFLRDSGRLEVIDREAVDEKFRDALSGLYEQQRFKIELSPKASFLKEYVLCVYSWARQSGHVVLERGRRIFSDLRSDIPLLELPEKADNLTRWKADYFETRLGFRGYRATKFFLAVSFGITGLVLPGASAAGLLIAFVDP